MLYFYFRFTRAPEFPNYLSRLCISCPGKFVCVHSADSTRKIPFVAEASDPATMRLFDNCFSLGYTYFRLTNDNCILKSARKSGEQVETGSVRYSRISRFRRCGGLDRLLCRGCFIYGGGSFGRRRKNSLQPQPPYLA